MSLTTAGIGRLGLVDQDAVELSNLHRQICHTEARVGRHKADSAAEACCSLNSSIQVRDILMWLSSVSDWGAAE